MRKLVEIETVLVGWRVGQTPQRVRVRIEYDLNSLAGSSMVRNAVWNKGGVSNYDTMGMRATLLTKEDAPGEAVDKVVEVGKSDEQILLDLTNALRIAKRDGALDSFEFSNEVNEWLSKRGRRPLI